jgi:hypothetical protein
MKTKKIEMLFINNTMITITIQAQQTPSKMEMIMFQGKQYYQQVNEKHKSSHSEITWIYEVNADTGEFDYVGRILFDLNLEYTVFRNFQLISRAGHTYHYNFDTERLIYFQYGGAWDSTLPQDAIDRLESFQRYIQAINSENDYTGAFHELNLDERFPEEQFEPTLLK